MPGEADAVQNIKDLKASADAAAARASDLQAQYDKAAKGIKAPDTGTVPDVQPDPQEPSRVPLDEATAHGIRQFGLMSLAMMAISPRSAGASVEAATRFLAGAVNGLNQGNVERYKLEMDHWQNAISEAHAKNQEVMQRYNAVLRSKMIPFETKLKELSVIATQAHDATTAAMLAQGRVSQAFDHLQTQQMGWSRLLQAGDGIKARADAHAESISAAKATAAQVHQDRLAALRQAEVTHKSDEVAKSVAERGRALDAIRKDLVSERAFYLSAGKPVPPELQSELDSTEEAIRFNAFQHTAAPVGKTPTDSDLEYTAKKHGITVDEVRKRLGR